MKDLSSLTDTELVALCLERKGRDERPYIEFIRRYHMLVTRGLYSYFSNEQDVQDLSQEIFFKIYHSLHQFEGRSSVKTWIFSITSNTAKNELRKRSLRPVEVEESIEDKDEVLSSGEEPYLLQEIHIRQVFQKAFSMLTKQEQEIILLKDIEELTYGEVANRLVISLSAAKMRTQRARLAMKKYYQESDHGNKSPNFR